MSRNIPPHTIPPKDRRDQFHEIQIPLHDTVDSRPPPPGWNRDGTRSNGHDPKPAYNPEVPRWNF